MPRARPRRHAAVVLALVASLLPGCFTRALWNEWPEPPPPTPVALQRAVRTGTGAFHVQAAFSDGSVRHLAVRPFEEPGAAGADEAWPDAIRRADIVAEVDGPLPEGAPLQVAGAPPIETSEGEGPPEAISLEEGALRVVNPVTGGWTLATFERPREPSLAQQIHDHHLRVVIVGMTPLAALLDATVGLVVLGPLAPAAVFAGW